MKVEFQLNDVFCPPIMGKQFDNIKVPEHCCVQTCFGVSLLLARRIFIAHTAIKPEGLPRSTFSQNTKVRIRYLIYRQQAATDICPTHSTTLKCTVSAVQLAAKQI